MSRWAPPDEVLAPKCLRTGRIPTEHGEGRFRNERLRFSGP
jgi:hypothetical protein